MAGSFHEAKVEPRSGFVFAAGYLSKIGCSKQHRGHSCSLQWTSHLHFLVYPLCPHSLILSDRWTLHLAFPEIRHTSTLQNQRFPATCTSTSIPIPSCQVQTHNCGFSLLRSGVLLTSCVVSSSRSYLASNSTPFTPKSELPFISMFE